MNPSSNQTYTSRISAFTSRTTTIFTSNTNNSNVSNGQEVVFDENFKNALMSLFALLTYYAVGDYITLAATLTPTVFMSLSISLGAFVTVNETSELLKSTAFASLQGLQRAAIQYTQLRDLNQLYVICKGECDILHNLDLLRAYLEQLNMRSSSSVFGNYTIAASVPAVIPPEYLRYIQLHGFPQDGVFDVALLAQIA